MIPFLQLCLQGQSSVSHFNLRSNSGCKPTPGAIAGVSRAAKLLLCLAFSSVLGAGCGGGNGSAPTPPPSTDGNPATPPPATGGTPATPPPATGGTPATPPPAASVTLSATISNLYTPGLVLSTGSATVAVAINATSALLSEKLTVGAAYKVSIAKQPTGFTEFCVLSNGAGIASTTPINVTVRCHSALAMVSTFAGSGVRGFVNAGGKAARFNAPHGVAADSAGNIYVADFSNGAVRKIGPDGVVSTFAGTGAPGDLFGANRASTLYMPTDVAVDGAGTVYVADPYANRIRKVTAAGVVTTLAGTGDIGSADGSAVTASFNHPNGVAVDGAGNVYVADSENNLIRKISLAGMVSTLAGSGRAGNANGIGSAASFDRPQFLVADAAGTLYVADTYNHLIRMVTPAGVVSTIAGTGSLGTGVADATVSTATFAYPQGIARDSRSGDLYVCSGEAIQKISPAGAVTTLAGRFTVAAIMIDGPGASATFFGATGLSMDAAGSLYVADVYNHAIRKIDAQ
jgi:serine/threonine-protein kinase